MRVAIVYNQPERESDGARAAEYGVLTQVRDIEASFRRLGLDSINHAVTSVTGLVEFLTRVQPEVVFNCCESFRGTAVLEASVASVYDLCGIAYTGSPALTLGMALDKGIAKSLFRAAGVPTPPHVVMRTESDLQSARELTYPLIVKPLAEDASIGIDAGSVVGDETALLARVRSLWSVFERPALVEEFIDGREITVALLADSTGAFNVLPVSDIVFGALPPGVPAIVTYDAKWVPESADYKATPARCPADLDADLAGRIGQVAVAAAHAVGLRDYGRVDLRLRTADHAIFVLEVNANPDLSTDAGFMRAAAAGGLTAAATIERILACAVTRARDSARAQRRSTMSDIVLRRHRLTHLLELRVEPSMLTARFAPDCSMTRCTGRCCAHGVYVELSEREAILDNAAAIQAQMDPSQAKDPALWFDPEPIEDADFPSGRAVGTAEVNGGCVFLNEAGRCVLQKASTVQTGNLKPFFCVAFPVTIDKGALCLDDPRAVDCCTPDPSGLRTVFDLCAQELDHMLGAEGVSELRRLSRQDSA